MSSPTLKMIKVNINDGSFWLVPPWWSVFSIHKRASTIKKARNLKEIIENNNLTDGNYYFSFNRDHDFELFNELQRNSDLNIEINQNIIKKIEKYKFYIFKIDENINLEIDEKSLYYLYRGYSFFVNLDYLKKLKDFYYSSNPNKDEFTFVWRKNDFKLVN